MSDQLIAEADTYKKTQQTQQTNPHVHSGIQTRKFVSRAASDLTATTSQRLVITVL